MTGRRTLKSHRPPLEGQQPSTDTVNLVGGVQGEVLLLDC